MTLQDDLHTGRWGPLQKINGDLFWGGLDLGQVPEDTLPVYLYDACQIAQNIQTLKDNLHGLNVDIHYAVKANSNIHILQLIKNQGINAEIVSGGEWHRCMKAGFEPSQIIFSGVGKSFQELALVIQGGIGLIHVESYEELCRIQKIAQELRRPTHVMLRLNPNVKAVTHPKVVTGDKSSKFGIGEPEIQACLDLLLDSTFLVFNGLGLHIGSQIRDLSAYDQAYRILHQHCLDMSAKGLVCQVLDLGGGFGVHSDASFDLEGYRRIITKLFSDFDGKLLIEPGRYITANAGILLTQIEYVKKSGDQRFVVLNAGMNDLMRPALYDAYHDLFPVIERPHIKNQMTHFVGPVCESSDIFASQMNAWDLLEGDLMVIAHAGAYGASMSNSYNSRPLIGEMMIQDGELYWIRQPRTTLSFLDNEIGLL